MAGKSKGAPGRANEESGRKEGGSTKGAALLVSSFVLVLTFMMFATGTAQRSAMPRLRAMTESLPFFRKPVASVAAPDTSSVPAAVGWGSAADSVDLLRSQLDIALSEIEAAREEALLRSAVGAAADTERAGSALPDSSAVRDLVKLVKVLDAMKPADAARILDQVDAALAVEAMRRLKERQAGKVLALMQPAKAIAVGAQLGRGAEGAE